MYVKPDRKRERERARQKERERETDIDVGYILALRPKSVDVLDPG